MRVAAPAMRNAWKALARAPAWPTVAVAVMLAAGWCYSDEAPPVLDRSGPAIQRDLLLVTAGDRVHAVDIDTRERIWSAELPTHNHSGVVAWTDDVGVITTDGTLLTLDVGRGSIEAEVDLWTSCGIETGTVDLSRECGLWIARDPNMILIRCESTCALSSSGELVWRSDVPVLNLSQSGDEALVILVPEDLSPMLGRLDLKTGTVVKSPRAFPEADGIPARPGPVVHGDTVLVAANGKLHAYDKATLEQLWETEPGPEGYGAPTAATDLAAFVTFPGYYSDRTWVGGVVTAVDLGTGNVRWQQRYEDRRVLAAVDAGGGILAVQTAFRIADPVVNYDYGLLGVDPRTGDLIWEMDSGRHCPLGLPLVVNGDIWVKRADLESAHRGTVRNYDLAVVDVQTGRVEQTIELPSRHAPPKSVVLAIVIAVFGTVLILALFIARKR